MGGSKKRKYLKNDLNLAEETLNMANEKNKLGWIIKYKLYHIPFWFLYNYLWWAVTIGSPVKALEAIFFSAFSIKFIFYLVFQAAAAYFNLYYLIPNFLEKRKIFLFVLYLAITIITAAACIVPGYYVGSYLSGRSVEDLYGPGSYTFYHLFIGSPLSSTAASVTLAMSVKLAKNWLQSQRKQQILEKEKLETELKFLKYQFNPHFLFNTINSIFFLIRKNPDKASISLAKFSDMLRYQLYECNDKQIPLINEITYIENFIELEKLRQNENFAITLEVNKQNMGNLSISPFILMTFVENAFKHVSKFSDDPNWISIKLDFDSNKLSFLINNSISNYVNSDVVKYGGIGLQNVRRRLDLVYAGKYTLDIKNDGNYFNVNLDLTLSELPKSSYSKSEYTQAFQEQKLDGLILDV